MSSGNSDIQNVVQDIEALRDRMDAQEAAIRTLEVNLDQRFRRLDQCFDEMINKFDALGDQLARGGVANEPVAANIQNQVAGYNSSDEEEDLILAEDQNIPTKIGGGRLNVDIHSFYGNLGIEDFVDWIAEIGHFF
ncbi:hypothetical protein M9H77_34842 [Catharanthus roseus]|uniref:Uncharacterized protein n=1 Tax=Catharanthus roseus TaxID=4058 RepID=A0ACB9ZPG8_CATRO|nr:hypothetical protein M9H77_34842 [Catharanthus roseus]